MPKKVPPSPFSAFIADSPLVRLNLCKAFFTSVKALFKSSLCCPGFYLYYQMGCYCSFDSLKVTFGRELVKIKYFND